MTVLDVAVLRDEAALATLAPDWAALWARCPQATPFQHPAWLLPWWQVFGNGRPRIATLWTAPGRLAALLPLYAFAAPQKLLPIGAGLSDYMDALVAPDAPPDAAAALLAASLRDCPFPCHLPDLPPGAHLRQAMAPPSWRDRLLDGPPCPVLALGAVPARQRRKLRMSRHRADRAGGFAVGASDRASAAGMFDELVRLHASRWAGRGGGVLADPDVLDFHRRALPLLAEARLLRLRTLVIAGRVVAAIHALAAPGRLFCYLGGFDPERAYESPGTLLLGAMLDEAAAEGATECHFLRGAEPYKYAWGAVDCGNALRILEPP